MNTNKKPELVREIPFPANDPDYSVLLANQGINLNEEQKKKLLALSPESQRNAYYEFLSSKYGGFYQ